MKVTTYIVFSFTVPAIVLPHRGRSPQSAMKSLLHLLKITLKYRSARKWDAQGHMPKYRLLKIHAGVACESTSWFSEMISPRREC